MFADPVGDFAVVGADKPVFVTDTLFPLDAPARPYHWAQWLAGLYVPPPPAIEESYSLTSRQRMEPSTKKIVEMVGTLRVRVLRNRLVGVDVNEQITQRIAVRHALDSQLSTLPTITVHPSCSRLFPTGNETLRCPLADFLSWKPVSLSEVWRALVCIIIYFC